MAKYKAAHSSIQYSCCFVGHPVSLMHTDGSKAAHSSSGCTQLRLGEAVESDEALSSA